MPTLLHPTCTFEQDDIVYIKSLTPTTSFMPKNLGPYVVIRKIQNDNYIIRDAHDETAKTINLMSLNYSKKIKYSNKIVYIYTFKIIFLTYQPI